MKSRHQRRSCPPSAISGDENPHYGYPGVGGDLVVITNLQGMRSLSCGSCHTVCPWQPMAMTSVGLRLSAHQRQYGIGKQPSQTGVQTT